VRSGLYLGAVGAGNELLELGKSVDLGEGVDQLRLNMSLLHLLPAHLEELDEGIPELLPLRGYDDIDVVLGVVGLDVRLCCCGGVRARLASVGVFSASSLKERNEELQSLFQLLE